VLNRCKVGLYPDKSVWLRTVTERQQPV